MTWRCQLTLSSCVSQIVDKYYIFTTLRNKPRYPRRSVLDERWADRALGESHVNFVGKIRLVKPALGTKSLVGLWILNLVGKVWFKRQSLLVQSAQ